MIELLDAEPFQPFDIRTSDGRAYMVDAPIYLARSRTGETVTYYTPEDDRMVVIRMSKIVSLEPRQSSRGVIHRAAWGAS